MTLASFLIGMVGPVMARILTSLGLSLVALTGATAAVTALRTKILDAVGTFPFDAVQLAGLFGVWHCLGMVLGTVTFCLTWRGTAGWVLGKAGAAASPGGGFGGVS